MEYIYRLHAIERMFQRDIDTFEVEKVVRDGEIIEYYEDDKPYASCLVLGYVNNIALHIVYAKDENDNIIVITAYKPSLAKWQKNFKKRKD